MAFDPRKQECEGLFLYGSGYFADEDDEMRTLLGKTASFCDECPAKRVCQKRHRERTQRMSPAHVERYERELRSATRQGIGVELFALMKFRAKDPDPYFRLAQENFQRGIADRREDSKLKT